MSRLGKNQIKFLSGMAGLGRAVVVGDSLLRGLAKRGLMKALADDRLYVITPAGLRAVADAIDAGTLPMATIEDFKQKRRVDP